MWTTNGKDGREEKVKKANVANTRCEHESKGRERPAGEETEGEHTERNGIVHSATVRAKGNR